MPYHPFDYSRLEYHAWPPLQRFFRRIFVCLFRLLIRLHIEGLENIPPSGPFIMVANHLDFLDAPLGLIFVPRRMVGFVKKKWQRPPISWLLESMSDVIYVGKSDRHALQEALVVLRSGGVLAILPEGTRSRSGAMGKGQQGVALLATLAPAPVLPAAVYGQERTFASWKRLRRAPIYARIGTFLELPAGKANKQQMEAYTDLIMTAIARLLPPEYRGVYTELAGDTDQVSVNN